MNIIIKMLKEILENMDSDLFQLDCETEEELMKCGAREFYVEETKEGLEKTIELLENLNKIKGIK